MDKKEIYEHLANIYLDASSNKKNGRKIKEPKRFRYLFFSSLALIAILCIALFTGIYRHNASRSSQIALVLSPDVAKINFNFDPAKKEIYSINLNKLNLAAYKELAFSLKKKNFFDTIYLRVEFVSAYNEKSFVYLKDLPHKWGHYTLKFSEFKNISDWTKMANLEFIVEEWNAKEKKGVIYIDNVRVLR